MRKVKIAIRITSGIMVLIISFVTCTFALAIVPPATNSTGVSMTIEEFKAAYVGDNYFAHTADLCLTSSSTNEPSVAYSNIVYNSESRMLSFVAHITIDEVTLPCLVTGTLYNSWKKDYGTNSIVGDMNDCSGNFDILAFEIYNDTNLSRLYSPFSTASGPILKLYLRQGSALYFFESEIPTTMSEISIANLPENKATKGAVDGFWFESIVAPTYQETTSTIMPLADDSGTIQYPYISGNWTISGVVYRYYAVPYIYYRFTDVYTANADWIVKFGIADAYAIVHGERADSLSGLRVTDVTISFVTGPYTLLVSGCPVFDLNDSSSITGVSPDSILGYISIAAGASGSIGAQLATEVLATLISATSNSHAIENNDPSLIPVNQNEPYRRGFSYNIPTRYFLQHEDNYIQYNLKVASSKFGDPTATSGNRVGQIQVGIKYYTNDIDSGYSKTYDITRNYYCNLE